MKSRDAMEVELEPRYGSIGRCHDPLELLRKGIDFDRALMNSTPPSMKKHGGKNTEWRLTAAIFMVSALAFISGCDQSLDPGTEMNAVSNGTNRSAYMSITAQSPPSDALGKQSTASLEKLVFLIASNNEDTLRDTLTYPSASSSDASAQAVTRNYEVLAQRSWIVDAEVLNADGKVVQEGSATTRLLDAQDTAKVVMNLSNTTIERVGTSTIVVVIPDTVP